MSRHPTVARRRFDGPASQTLELGRVERIAVFQALHLGDLLCLVPALRALRARFPEAEVTFIGLPWAGAILPRYDYVHRFLEFPGYRDLEGVPETDGGTRAFLEAATSYGFDISLQMHGDGRLSNGFVAELGARVSVGHRLEGSGRPRQLDLELPYETGIHEVWRWLRMVEALGASGDPSMEFPIATEERMEAERLISSHGADPLRPYVVVHPGASSPEKRWPAERFARVGDLLAETVGGQVLITGTEPELPVALRVAGEMRTRPFVLAGETGLGALAALVARAALVVTNDTGPSHLAAAAGIPSVVLFGPTDPTRWAPLDRRIHRALWHGPHEPITRIPVREVEEESLALLERYGHPARRSGASG